MKYKFDRVRIKILKGPKKKLPKRHKVALVALFSNPMNFLSATCNLKVETFSST